MIAIFPVIYWKYKILQDNHASFTFLRHEISHIELNLVDGKDDDTEENL